VPYSQRIQPGDLGIGDVVPTEADDERLIQTYAALPGEEELDNTQIFEFGLTRARVISIIGRDLASKRWYDGDRGPRAPIAQAAPKPCSSCGFFIPIAGSLGGAFGGADFNPYTKSETEIQRFCQSYMTELAKYIGPDTDLPGLGEGVTNIEVGYMYGQYKRINHHCGQVGKGLMWGGSPVHVKAQGYGIAYFAKKMLENSL
jgi:hypothetical protein